MTSNFGANDDSKQPLCREMAAELEYQQSLGALDNLKRDRFELLSAYLDGEITAAERRQVESWLQSDPVVQRLYHRLLRLRQGIHALPVPSAEQTAEQTIGKVFSRLNHRPKVALAWAGMAIAATFVGVLSNVFSPGYQSSTQVADFPDVHSVSTTALMIAVDRPVIEIPKAPVSSPDTAAEDSLGESGLHKFNDTGNQH